MQIKHSPRLEKTSIIIVDDHRLIRQMWRLMLEGNDIEIIGESGELHEAIEMIKTMRPDIVLLDVNLGLDTGLEAVPIIRRFSPGTRIMIVSMHTHAAYANKTLQLGVRAYITKNSSREEMLDAVEVVMKGGIYICNEIRNIQIEDANDFNDKTDNKILSLREIEIIKLIKQGHSSKEISSILHIGSRTVEVHRYNILKKLQLKNTAAMINFINNTDLNFI